MNSSHGEPAIVPVASPTRPLTLHVGAATASPGAELRGLGVISIVGVDLLSEAAAAARRDRPEV